VPHTRNEWIVFVAGLLLVGFLVAEILVHRSDTNPSVRTVRHSTPGTTAPHRDTTTAPRITTTTRSTTTVASIVPSTTTTTTARLLRLRLRATADTWLLVRRTSPSGALVYQGTLVAGASRSFTGASFSVRFGAAANVAATLNGRPLPLPSGTYSVTIGSTGLGPRSA
jgi:hypothetical protein